MTDRPCLIEVASSDAESGDPIRVSFKPRHFFTLNTTEIDKEAEQG